MSVSSPRVSIVLTNRDGGPNVLGQVLQDRLTNVALNDAADPSADINYYITAQARKTSAPTLEMGWFAAGAAAGSSDGLLVEIARTFDWCVTPSQTLCNDLHQAGLQTAQLIMPGIDPAHFGAGLRVGVIAGDAPSAQDVTALRADMAALPEVDWQFAPAGPAAQRAAFYRGLDYLLIPTAETATDTAAAYVTEALAMGTEVIVPAHFTALQGLSCIPFEPENPQNNLQHVLQGLLQQKHKLRDDIEIRSWDRFAQAHERLFHALMDHKRIDRPSVSSPAFQDPVRLLIHGNENKVLGGPTVRVPRTARALSALGVPARAEVFEPGAPIAEQVVHLFNVWSPLTALEAMRDLKAAGKTVVFSPIYLDFSERAFWQLELPDLLGQPDIGSLGARYAAVQAYTAGRGRLHEAIPGYNAMVREMISLADHVIFLSTAERAALARIGADVEDARASLIVNPVDADVWSDADPRLFRDTYLAGRPGPSDYIICIGRLEERKNQLMLARALRDLPVQLVFVGHAGNPEYAARLRREAGPNVLILDRLEPASAMLGSAITGAAAFVLASWAEGAALVALEAAACGTALVLSDRSSEREYFGDLVDYCDPGDPDTIRHAVERALAAGDDPDRSEALRTLIKTRYNWEDHAALTAQAYAKAAAWHADAGTPSVGAQSLTAQLETALPRDMGEVMIDITPADPEGPNRSKQTDKTNADLIETLQAAGISQRMMFWSANHRCFVEVPKRFDTLARALEQCCNPNAAPDLSPLVLSPDCTILTLGTAWMEQPDYLRDLENLKARTPCQLLILLHNLAPILFPFRTRGDHAGKAQGGFRRLSAFADCFITTSHASAQALAKTPEICGIERADVSILPLDGIIRQPDGDVTPAIDAVSASSVKPDPVNPTPMRAVQTICAGLRFVLVVGDITPQSGHEMLYRIWARFAEEDRACDLHLVIAGALGPSGHQLADRIARDRRVSPRIHILTDVSDADRDWLYAQCLFTVLPAQDCDWARPAMESLLHGKICLATATGGAAEVAPETTPDLIEYIDSEDFGAWGEKIETFATSSLARQLREAAISQAEISVSGQETADSFVQIVTAPRRTRLQQPLYTGEIAVAGATGRPLALRFGPGWYPAEPGTRWAAQSDVSVWMQPKEAMRPDQTRLTVMLKVKSALPETTSARFAVSCNNKMLFVTQTTGAAFPETVFVSVPIEALDSDGVLKLDLHLPVIQAGTEQEVGPETQTCRPVGVGLHSVVLLDPDLSNPLQAVTNPEHWSDGTVPLQIDLQNEAHCRSVAPGLSFSSAWGAGAQGGAFELRLPLLPGAPTQTLCLTVRPIARPAAPVRAIILLNGRVLTEQRWQGALPETLEITLPAADLAACGPAILSVQTDSLKTPIDLRLGHTTDLAGLGAIDLSLAPERN